MVDTCWQISGWYLLVLFPLVMCMKLLSLRRNWPKDRTDLYSFLLAPSFCLPSWGNRRKVCRKDVFVLGGKGIFFCTFLWLLFNYELKIPADLSPWLQGYLAVIPFWLLLEIMQTFLQVLWLPTGRLVPPMNVHPFLSVSVVDFWGRRWNRLFGDWLFEICFKPFSRKPYMGMFLAFFVSGMIHELLVSVPFLMVYERSLFGLMLGYFTIQFLAIVIERRVMISSSVAGRVFCWIVILGPAPMVLNSGTLKIFQMVTTC
jgi:hypothetical protein